MTTILLGAMLIFCLRIGDVTFGTLRILAMVKGKRVVATVLGLAESGTFIFALSTVLGDKSDPILMVGYASGYAAGTYIGMTLERWVNSASLIYRIIGKNLDPLVAKLREMGVGATVVQGQGREGPVMIVFAVASRKHQEKVLSVTGEMCPQAFVTIETVSRAIGGYILPGRSPLAIAK